MTRNDERQTSDADRTKPGLPKLSIHRYRGIQNITVNRLAQVTLIAGANGVGKTRLLEAAAKTWKTSVSPQESGGNRRAASATRPITWVCATDLDAKTRTKWWTSANLSGAQSQVTDAVREIVTNLKGISLISPDSDTPLIPVAMTTSHSNPVPLRTLGSGAMRFFEIALAIANTQNGLLLIEAPDAGVHYTAHATLWAMILDGAIESGIQVIATTHSTDSIYALGEAAGTRDDHAAAYLRLEKRNDETRAVEYTMPSIRVADEQNIAVA